jgi:hypothetical protein
MGRTLLQSGPSTDSYGGSFDPAQPRRKGSPSTGARSPVLPGTGDLTHRRTDAFDISGPGGRNTTTVLAP